MSILDTITFYIKLISYVVYFITLICIIYNISTFIKLKKTKEYNFSEYLEHKSGGLSFMILQIIISGLFIATTHVLVSNPIT